MPSQHLFEHIVYMESHITRAQAILVSSHRPRQQARQRDHALFDMQYKADSSIIENSRKTGILTFLFI